MLTKRCASCVLILAKDLPYRILRCYSTLRVGRTLSMIDNPVLYEEFASSCVVINYMKRCTSVLCDSGCGSNAEHMPRQRIFGPRQ